MKIDRATKIIMASRLSEKSTRVQVDRQYVFQVCNRATKNEITQAINQLFNVDVESVRVINMKGKKRSFKNIAGRLNNWKKAYITIKEGQSINFSGI